MLDEDGERTAAEIDGADYRHLDVRSEPEWEQVVADVVARHGHLDVLVNNAAIDLIKRLEATTMEEWDRVVAINQTGVFLGMRTAAKAMMAGRRRLDRQHQLGRRPPGRHRPRRLHRHQVRGAGPDQGGVARSGAATASG